MGSDAGVIVVGDPRLLDVARARIDQLESRWSRFIAESEVSGLNARRGEPHPVSVDTFRLIQRSVQAWRDTAGRFDPTVLGDMIRAGYDRTIQAVVLRGAGGVSLLQRNASGIRFDAGSLTVELPADAGFDPGGLGKGLAADIVVEELLERGALGACVNLGGDLRVDGTGPDEGRWVISIEHPADGATIGLIALKAGGVATSTSVKRAWRVGGELRHHLIDPFSGAPLRSSAIAVTALSKDAASAEIATKYALLAEAGSQVEALEELGCDGLIVTDENEVVRSRGFDAFVIEEREEAGG
jgi:FAD:protein FMN transferase